MAGRDLRKSPDIGPRIVFLSVEGTHGSLKEIAVRRVDVVDERKVREVLTKVSKREIENLMKLLDRYDIVATWGGSRLELPLLTAQALKFGVDPSPLYALTHVDLEAFVRDKLRILDTDLKDIATFLGVGVGRTKADTVARVFKRLRSFIRNTQPELAL
ncbi:MAG: ribonuclease H-like domain-containing protein [Candidatus Caldarchaeum sp.]|nr:ribonuclease H-like domain-containing protein [Candidatus Caldarchaeum sp.]MDW7977979.1 ribonuclease H-like domain-containing protein [Candidatus Caldarchaeum sp.]MDW8359793.1 ribonuclease H-like domain-containing protein [Candidatus Caldarchaeum sp.]